MIIISSKSPAQQLSTWNGRTRFAVYGQVFLFLVAWAVALSQLIGTRFWDRQHCIDNSNKTLSNPNAYNGEACNQRHLHGIFYEAIHVVLPACGWRRCLVESVFLAADDSIDTSKIQTISLRPGSNIDAVRLLASSIRSWIGIHHQIVDGQTCVLSLGHWGRLQCFLCLVFCGHCLGHSETQILVNKNGWIHASGCSPACLLCLASRL